MSSNCDYDDLKDLPLHHFHPINFYSDIPYHHLYHHPQSIYIVGHMISLFGDFMLRSLSWAQVCPTSLPFLLPFSDIFVVLLVHVAMTFGAATWSCPFIP